MNHVVTDVLTEKRRKLVKEGTASINSLRNHLKGWRNAEKISELLDEIEASKVILYGLYEHGADAVLIDFLSSYNKILHELLQQSIVEGVN